MRSFLPAFLLVIATALLTAAAIYLSPLKWVNVVTPSFKDIDPKAFEAEYSANPSNYLFFDVRQNSAYSLLHAVGAQNLPLQSLYDTHWSLPKSGKTIVFICSGGQSSGIAYMYMQHYGYFNILRIAGGIENWSAEGMPVEGTSVPTAGSGSGQ